MDARDARYDAIVQGLRDREGDDREAREKRQRWYRQYLKMEPGTESSPTAPWSRSRLHRFRTKVPCRATPEARALLDELRKQFPGGRITFPQLTTGRQAVMLTGAVGTEPRQIGWIEHSVQTDAKRCNVRDQGLVVEADGGSMLLLRFRYPPTPVRISSRHDAGASALPRGGRRIERRASLSRADEVELPCDATGEMACVEFSEIRPALELRPTDRGSSPRLVWVTRPEVQTMDALRSRDYEAFYLRFKLEVLAGVWSSLSAQLATSSGSRWHRGSHYTVVREPAAAKGRIIQRTVDDSGRAVDIGLDRVYDAAPATDILLLYLEGDILADFADICFTLQSLDSAEAYFLKEEFFTVIRRFWGSARSLASSYGSDLATVVRMSQRAAPMPGQAPLLKQDWTSLRQSLVDRYGEGGRKAGDLVGEEIHRRRVGPAGWPFASFPAGEINVGLRVVYRQEWTHLGAQRGAVTRANAPETPVERGRASRDGRSVATTIERADTTRTLDEIVSEAVEATVEAMKWPLNFDGSLDTGVRELSARTDMGLESECRESSRETARRLTDIMARVVERDAVAPPAAANLDADEGVEPSSTDDVESAAEEDAATYVCSAVQHRFEVLTRPAEIENVILVAEKLPTPAEIDASWVRRHDWMLRNVLLDESFREALETIRDDARSPESTAGDATVDGARDAIAEGAVDAKRERLYEHLRANILHYQRAIWQQEDPQQRSMRYRKSGRKVPLEWRFELESGGALTIDELGDRLGAPNVDGQFAAYAAGREAELDQVIDPAGPIGYYGNFAVYHMRPELGSEELFAMLHFFKSPYLRWDEETGEREVDDPLRIQLADDPAVAAVSDQQIAEHRDEMFEYVPELRLELARARQQTSEGSDPGAVDRLERQTDALRRHYATYLFRRERARRIVLDTADVAVDVVRRADPSPSETSSADSVIALGATPEEHQLVLEGARGLELLTVNARREADAEWSPLRRSGDQETTLVVGAGHGAAPSASQAVEPAIVARGDGGERMLTLRPGPGHDAESVEAIVARHAVGLRLAAPPRTEAADAAEPAIVSASRDERTPILLAGAGAPDPCERLILTRAPHADRDSSPPDEPLALSSGDGAPPPTLRAGLAHASADAESIIARGHSDSRLTAVAGAGASQGEAPHIVARGNRERMRRLRAGRVQDPAAQPGIRARDDEGLRLTSTVPAGAAPAHERVILVDDDEWLRPILIAG